MREDHLGLTLLRQHVPDRVSRRQLVAELAKLQSFTKIAMRVEDKLNVVAAEASQIASFIWEL